MVDKSSYSNPQPIPWPTSGLGCTEVLDLRLRITFCDAVVLFTVYRNLRLIKWILNIEKLWYYNVFKQSNLIYTLHNLHPSFVFQILLIAQNCIDLNLNTLSSITPFLNIAWSIPSLMALDMKRPRLDEEWIGQSMPSG